MTIRAYARTEYLVSHVLRKNSAYQLTRAVECFIETIGRDLPIAELSDAIVNQWLVACELKYAPRTVRRMRADILAIWRDAFDAGECAALPRRIRKIKVGKPIARAWSILEVVKLVAASEELPGRMRNGNRRSDYFAALVTGTWSTGLRKSDMFSLYRPHIRPDGTILHTQHKTQDGHCAQLDENALHYLRRLNGDYPYEWLYAPRIFYYWWKKLKSYAGVESDGALQRLRKSATTDVVKNKRGSPTAFLGHTTPAADPHYIDWSLIPGSAVTPTPLPLVKKQKWLWLPDAG